MSKNSLENKQHPILQIKAKPHIHYFTSNVFSWMNRKGNLLWPLIKRRHVPGLTSYVERYFPKELHVSVPKKKKPTNSEHKLTSSWVAEGAQKHSVVHWQEKKVRETNDEVMRVFHADLLRQSTELLVVSVSSS